MHPVCSAAQLILKTADRTANLLFDHDTRNTAKHIPIRKACHMPCQAILRLAMASTPSQYSYRVVTVAQLTSCGRGAIARTHAVGTRTRPDPYGDGRVREVLALCRIRTMLR